MSEWFSSWFDSPYYPILYQHRDYSEADGFVKVLLNKLNLPEGSRILDLACGRGRHAQSMHKMGYKVLGMDLSPQSIADAAANAAEGLNFKVHDMREPFKAGHFDLIANLFTSFGYFNDTSENLKVLQNVHESLNPKGQFVLDFMNVNPVIRNLVKAETKELSGVHYNISRKVEDGRIIKRIDVNDAGKTASFQESVQALNLSDFQALFKEAGLKITRKWGDYAGNDFSEQDSPRLILFSEIN